MQRDLRELWNFGNPAESEQRFREYLPESGDQRLEVVCQIGRCLGLQGKFDEGEELLNTVLDDWETANDRAKTCYFLEQGRLLNSNGDPKGAKPLFMNAVEHSGEELDLRIDALHMLGIVDTGQPGLGWNLQAIELARGATDPRASRWLASLLNNTAWTLHDMGRPTEALNLFEEAVPLREAQGAPEPLKVAKWAVARCKRSLGLYEVALAEQQALKSDNPDAFIEEEIGENLWALERFEEAVPHLDRAAEMLALDEWFAKHESSRLQNLRARTRPQR